MSPTHDTLADQIERLLNLQAGLALPMPAEIHVEALKEALPEITTELRAVHKELTGDDPWEDQP